MTERLQALGIYPGRVFDLREPSDVVLLGSVPAESTFTDDSQGVWRKTASGWRCNISSRNPDAAFEKLKLIAVPSGDTD